MLLGRHASTIAALGRDPRTATFLRAYFALPGGVCLMHSLCVCGLGQADVVFALLRLRDETHFLMLDLYISWMVGRPILVCPPCLLHWHHNTVAPSVRLDTSPRITWVVSNNPRQPSTSAALRWEEFRVGRTVAQLRVRGVTRRDVRRARRMGWIKLEEQMHVV